MGTLGKALGSLGAFVAGSRELIEYLVNSSRSFIFTTALPPPIMASALAALDILEERPSLVVKLQDNASYLRQGLRELGYHITRSQTQILPVIIGQSNLACETSRQLLKEGVLATAIRPPSVPEGTSRIRVTLMATHTTEDLDFALSTFEKVGLNLKII
jgi:7-keto-8-aminopelargonate synthetase-like enzyme